MKIVVVEDNEILAKSIAKVLIADGHAVRCFGDGGEAYSFLMIEKGAVDLAIVDYMLPGMDGVSLIAALREAGISIPFPMLTASAESTVTPSVPAQTVIVKKSRRSRAS